MDCKKILAAAVATLSTLSVPAFAGGSANIGLASDYIFRGFDQASGATASFGVDVDQNGFYAGTWVADVVLGSEVDLYAGYKYQSGDLTLGLGATGYFYTDDALEAAEAKEINLLVGYGGFELAYSSGEPSEGEGEYDVTELSYNCDSGWRTKLGIWGQDMEGEWLEVGYGTDVSGFDVGLDVIASTKEINIYTDKTDVSVVFSLGKTFDF
jgi:uncharacterized protein (TIGR02001 family)